MRCYSKFPFALWAVCFVLLLCGHCYPQLSTIQSAGTLGGGATHRLAGTYNANAKDNTYIYFGHETGEFYRYDVTGQFMVRTWKDGPGVANNLKNDNESRLKCYLSKYKFLIIVLTLISDFFASIDIVTSKIFLHDTFYFPIKFEEMDELSYWRFFISNVLEVCCIQYMLTCVQCTLYAWLVFV